ncbi:MAG: YeiH family protein [Janthinobacterium lividum]
MGSITSLRWIAAAGGAMVSFSCEVIIMDVLPNAAAGASVPVSGSRWAVARLGRVVPGVALCFGVTLVATLLQGVETRLVGEPYLEALVLAILLGVAIRTAWTPGPRWAPGIVFSAKFLLEVAVVMLGASVSAATVLALGPLLIVGIAIVVAIAIGSSYGICRLLGLPQRMAILVACGNSICGNSAIAAVAPVIGADGEDVASSIAFTAVLGVVVVLVLPLLVPILQMSLTQYGVLAGLTVYAVPQVLAATLPIGALSNQVGTVVKLVRVLMLGPVVLALSLLTRRLRDETDEPAPRMTAGDRPRQGRPALHELLPWFIVGFLIVLVIRSLGLIPGPALPSIAASASLLTTVSMAALGLGVDVRVVARAGLRVTAAVTASLIVLGAIGFALIRVLGVA